MDCYRKLLDQKNLAATSLSRLAATARVFSITTKGVPMHSSTVNGAPILGVAIDSARRRAGMSDQDLAWAQGISPAQWSRQLHGHGHIALDRLAQTPHAFREALIEQLEHLWDCETTLETLHDDLDALRREIHAQRKVA